LTATFVEGITVAIFKVKRLSNGVCRYSAIQDESNGVVPTDLWMYPAKYPQGPLGSDFALQLETVTISETSAV
jgi:hypothetical protein